MGRAAVFGAGTVGHSCGTWVTSAASCSIGHMVVGGDMPRCMLSHSVGVIYGSLMMADDPCGLYGDTRLCQRQRAPACCLPGQSIGQPDVTAYAIYVLT